MSYIQMLIEWNDGRPMQRIVFETVEAVKDALMGFQQKFGFEFDDNDMTMVNFIFTNEEYVTFSNDDMSITLLTVEAASEFIDSAVEEARVANDPLIAYVLMRTDVPDYFGPKAQAQSNHAGTKMVIDAMRSENAVLIEKLNTWEKEAGGFGTCIVLHASAAQMRQAVSLAKLLGVHADVIHDPTFPVRDGDRYTTLPIDTCAYVFGYKSECRAVVGALNLLSVV